MLTKEEFRTVVKANNTWVLIEKVVGLDGAKKIGSIHIPDSVNTNTMESKIGKIISVGSGHAGDTGRLDHSSLEIGRYCYYTRYGKEQFEGSDSGRFVTTRYRGILAYVDLDDSGYPCHIEPLHDRLWVEPCGSSEKVLESGIVLPDKKIKATDYRRYKVLGVGQGEPKKYKHHIDLDDRIPCMAKIGDIVIATPQNGVKISWGNANMEEVIYKLIPEKECIAIVNE